MAQPQNHNNNDLNDRQNAVLERLEALEAKNRILNEEIALLESAKLRHDLLIGLLFYILVPIPIISAIISGTIYLCVIINNPWFSFLALIIGYVLLQLFLLYLVMGEAGTDGQEMREPLRELLEMAEAQEAELRELRQEEEEAIRRAHERRRYQEQLLQQQREMAGRGRDAEDEDVAQCTICLEQFNLYGNVAILPCQHIFHRACIELWLQRKDTCPVCRTKTDTYYWWRIPGMDMDDVDD